MLSGTKISAAVIKLNSGKAYDILGHCNRRAIIEVAEALKWVITGVENKPCMHCTTVKGKRKALNRTGNPKRRKSNGRIGIDISTIKSSKNSDIIVSKPNWIMVIDERSGLQLSSFHKNKDDIVPYLADKFSMFTYDGSPVLKVRCDNAGENKSTEREVNSRKWRLNIKFEYTARNTPQQSLFTKIAISTMVNRGRAILNRANVPEKCRAPLFRYAVTTATKFDLLLIVEFEGSWSVPKFAKYLRTWGEDGTVTTKTDSTPKPKDRRVHCLFVGYAEGHAGDCYQM